MNNDDLLSKFTKYIKSKLNGGDDKKKLGNGKKSDKLLGNLVLMILVAVVIVLGSSFFKNNSSTSAALEETQKDKIIKETKVSGLSDYESQLENKLKSTLEEIRGVGKVQLMIYFESGEESVPAVNINDSESLTVENDTGGGKRNITQKNDGRTVVMSNNGNTNEPLIVKKYKPIITGVCVVAEGSNEKITELRIRQAVINLFNLPENKVNVYPMNN
ncbi:stage III sporulation protein AG [Clostridium tagluense]|uniref:stage III sporulation protein AG n=1 Tax=Clostridium tagluense TaxID=360422 RepID=UPI001C0DB3A9|nr:stage III sporulation protein AG [Clostridium tagluense]MBU3126574.1 stage III sporulation protein AG [Clostridium tagluense]MCB2309942.1 stage III sporulation protein AG [Clostridium tagluense]MCB2314528.1 stage III sporulation protein AG [Clostridium tagluense]MCB2319376.1 stage III sporulation protein AG [Clostridium tagluense]MCB2324536.1 stage III sporulation protein AG [Clostridium tagluense]